jgi:predicted metal-binding membrane protein
MTAIIQWLINLSRTVVSWFKNLINVFVRFSMTTCGVIVIIASLAWGAYTDAVAAMTQIVNAFGDLSVAMQAGDFDRGQSVIAWILSVANTFAPLDEAAQYGAAFLVMVVGFGLYKFLKSWLPEVFGWSVGQGSGT